jgi:mono/diheme cytochrome c family protein
MRHVILATAIVLLGAAAASCGDDATADPLAATAAPVERGRYLVESIGCHDCHTPKIMGATGPEPDLSRRLAGHPEESPLGPAPLLGSDGWVAAANSHFTAWAGPWGVSFAANLTPDRNTGLGIWTEDMFVRAIRTGRHMGVSRPILPPMPWTVFRNLTDEDLKAIFAYLRSLPPVHNRVPVPVEPAQTH